jgi:hypothetical protein
VEPSSVSKHPAQPNTFTRRDSTTIPISAPCGIHPLCLSPAVPSSHGCRHHRDINHSANSRAGKLKPIPHPCKRHTRRPVSRETVAAVQTSSCRNAASQRTLSHSHTAGCSYRPGHVIRKAAFRRSRPNLNSLGLLLLRSTCQPAIPPVPVPGPTPSQLAFQTPHSVLPLPALGPGPASATRGWPPSPLSKSSSATGHRSAADGRNQSPNTLASQRGVA